MSRDLWGGSTGFGPSQWTSGAISPHVDVLENDKEIMIAMELAGVKEQDIQLSLHNGVLTVYGEKHPHDKEEWERSRYLAERAFGTFRRSINLPYGLDEDATQAEFNDGVLTIRIPRLQEVVASGKKIPIKPRTPSEHG
ncbi:MAG: Hsp20/alpha crystallin family protein [Gammaproteobacteria bacterium]|nr:Hsp20/alpha crystallin family protein [Gammaproteobacteria bacterium]MCP5425465.1 Hsp20/alpha crystallin family protein [Gammaproteobacteria bacterium]MCP5459932.1 Hsp20/alpha crystallin family protein [Gammaproteobacteria bacterium]